MTHGIMGNTPSCKLDKVKFLCWYRIDRHFAITEDFGIEMINVPLLPTGPDMDMVEKLVAEDPAIKRMWYIPKYLTQQEYLSDETVRRFAHLKPQQKTSVSSGIMHIQSIIFMMTTSILELLNECIEAGNPDMVFKFISTSKVSFPGSGIAALLHPERISKMRRAFMKFQTIGHDKLNQLRHVRFLKICRECMSI